MKTFTLIALLTALPLSGTGGPDRAVERQDVAQAVYDYVDALYLVDPSRIERSVHSDLAKRGYWRPGSDQPYEELHMSFDELRDLAGRWNRDGRVDPKKAPREVLVLDVLDQTATAKLTAAWGVDYLHLAKYDGTWKIVNVLWQSHPVESD